jgi:hypothetical protein
MQDETVGRCRSFGPTAMFLAMCLSSAAVAGDIQDGGMQPPEIRLTGSNGFAMIAFTVAIAREKEGFEVQTTFVKTFSKRSAGTYTGHLSAKEMDDFWRRLEGLNCWDGPPDVVVKDASSGQLFLAHGPKKNTFLFAVNWDVVEEVLRIGHLEAARTDYDTHPEPAPAPETPHKGRGHRNNQ